MKKLEERRTASMQDESNKTAHPNHVVEVEALRKEFGTVNVFHDISFSVRRGSTVSLLGPSGAGKSTLLRCMNALELPTGGRVAIQGETVFDGHLLLSKAELVQARKKLSMVFQQFNLFEHLSAIENVALALIVAQRTPRDQAFERAQQMLKRVGIAHRALARPGQLSGGEQQRVGIARALAVEPAAVLLDEPTSSLDPELRGEVLAVMRQLAIEDVTMVVVTHELSFAREVSDWVVFMDGGVVVEQGPPESVLENPSNPRTARFIGG